ncbi:MAG: ankyrin repeat domain-containing protein [Cyanobacteria bacterium HKST-UBA01]|nr:ankyrin repeat domain-containing protein [Cyanobacteria bacterium HKST-UBA01]
MQEGDSMVHTDQPVHEAARNDSKELAVMLKKNPALRDAPNLQNVTPLHAAVDADNFESVNLLLKAGANPNALDDEGEPPVFDAKSRKVMEALKAAGAKFDIYSKRGHYGFQHCAAYIRSIEALQFWWEQGISINHVPDFGWPALVGACAIGSREKNYDYRRECEIVEFLLRHGADINLVDRMGDTALKTACWEQSMPLIRLLLASGADPNIEDHFGTTPLHIAVQRKNEELVELLLKYKADPNKRDKYYETPIDYARERSFCLNIFEPLHKPKPEKPIPTPDEVISRLKNIPSFKDLTLLGCTEEEIDKLERHFNVTLPAAYRYFLERMGKSAGEFLSSDHVTFEYESLFEQAQNASYTTYCELTDKSFVFAEREGCQFFYFEADGSSDDPPVFRFDDGDFGSKQVTRTFWEFIEERVVDYENWDL